MALLYRYDPLTLENTLAHFLLLLLQLFLFLLLKILFFYGCKFLYWKKSWLDLALFTELNFEIESFVGSPFLLKRISPPSFRSLANLYGLEYPSILNCACGKDESSFISESVNISIFSLTDGTKDSNLFRKELTLRWLVISLLGFYFLRSLDLHKQLSLKIILTKFFQD